MAEQRADDYAEILVQDGVDALKAQTAQISLERKGRLFAEIGVIAAWNPEARQEDVNSVLRIANHTYWVGNEVVDAGQKFARAEDTDNATWRYRAGARVLGQARKEQIPNPLEIEELHEPAVQDSVRVVSLQYEIDDLIGARRTLRGALPYIFALSGPRREATLPAVHDTLLLDMAEVVGYDSRVGNRLLEGIQLPSVRNQANMLIRSNELDREFMFGNHWSAAINELKSNQSLLISTKMWQIMSNQLESPNFSVRSRAEDMMRAALKAQLHVTVDKEVWGFISRDVVDALATAGCAKELATVVGTYGIGAIFKSAAVILGRHGDIITRDYLIENTALGLSAEEFSRYFRYGLEQVPRDVR